jgi:hypothetical protein
VADHAAGSKPAAMSGQKWQPNCSRPNSLVRPSPLDPTGTRGPTRSAVRGRRWRRVATGWYVPADVDATVVEQRILEQSVRLPATGGVTGWAALRWRGAAFFDGTDQGGRRSLPVPLVIGGTGNLRPDPRVQLSWEQFAPYEREVVAGLPCATVERALFDEVRRTRDLRHGVVAIDMAAAARLISVEGFTAYVELRPAWTGVGLARSAVDLSSADSRSPQETLMRLVWVIDAQLPTPLCNQPLFAVDGRLLGYPDLFDPEAGLVGEYDGADHLVEDRRSSDRSREDTFRDHGLEYFVVVRGEMADQDLVVRRMLAARRRALFLPPERRRWTLDQPAWFRSRLAG